VKWFWVVLLSWGVWAEPAPSSQNFEQPRRRADGKPLCFQDLRVPVLRPQVLRRVPHDTTCFTQGLCFDGKGLAYESNGGLGRSSLRRFDPGTGQVLQETRLGNEFWAEGVYSLGPELLLLTWQNRRFFFFDEGLVARRTVEFFGSEGWGVTSLAERVAISDGSSRLQWFRPAPWKAEGTVEVTETGRPVDLLNELETVEGDIYANLWLSDYIAIVKPASGEVRAWLDCRGLLTPEEAAQCDVLNGIGYDTTRKELYVTGKLWPWLFVLRPL
jgi:glutamine cyclotransferase